MKKCQDDNDQNHGSIRLESEIKNTVSGTRCQISQNSSSVQEVIVKNHKKHKLYVDIRVEADNGYVEYDDTGDIYDEKIGKKISKKSSGNPGIRTFTFDLEQDGTDSEDLLEVTLKYYYDEDDEEEDKNTSVNSIDPKVDLT